MSKILLINGSPNEHGCTATALEEMAATFEKNGIEARSFGSARKRCPTALPASNVSRAAAVCLGTL